MWHSRRMAVLRLSAVVLSLLLWQIGVSSSPGAAADASPTRIATTFVSRLATGDFAGAETYLDPTMKSAAPEAALRQIWQSLIAQLGALQRLTGSSQQAAGHFQNVTLSYIFAHATADLVITVDQSGEIAGFHVVDVRQVAPYTAPGYVHPATFHEEAVTVGHAPWALPG